MTCATLASAVVSYPLAESAQRATPLSVPALALVGGPVDARLPLALLESVKSLDTPESDLDTELVHELRNKRLGLSDTVAQQIRRYLDASRRDQRVPFGEVLALARLIGRRPDADIAFRESGRRWARTAADDLPGGMRRAAHSLPGLFARPVALRLLRRVAKTSFDGKLVRQGSALILDIEHPVSADAAPNAIGCHLYEEAFREALLIIADAGGAVEHVMCRSRGDAHCQWRTEWRRS